jgi:hypothetical protein
VTLPRPVRAVICSRSGAGAVASRPCSWDSASVRAFIADSRAARSTRIDSTAGGRLRAGGGFTGQDLAGGGLGVDHVVLALAGPSVGVRGVDLDHVDALGEQVAGQPGSVGPRRLDADLPQSAELVQPVGQPPVSSRCGRERAVREPSAVLVEHDHMVGVLVGVHASDDRWLPPGPCRRHPGHVSFTIVVEDDRTGPGEHISDGTQLLDRVL